jgi:hypothetical protein
MTLQDVYSLVPDSIHNRRPTRYRGKSVFTLERDFSLDEQLIIQRQYAQLEDLWKHTHPDAPDKRAQFEALENFLQNNELLSLEDQLLSIVGETEDKARKRLVIQLVRGAFEGVCAYVVFVRAGTLEPEYVQQLHYLAADHMKVMRMLLPDLDTDKRIRDEERHEHSIQLIAEKWRSKTYLTYNDSVRISFTTHFSGSVAERGAEFAEIDRIFYHLVNYFANYTADQEIHISVAQSKDQQNLIWVFSKQVMPDRRKYLNQLLDKGESLFSEDEGGEPDRDDLPIVADAIAHAYGYEDTREAEKIGCFGANLQGEILSLWFHWPAVAAK